MGYILLMGLMLLWDSDNVYFVREGYIIMVIGYDDIVMIDMLWEI